MTRDETAALLLPYVITRMRPLLGDEDLGNGTLLADAVATVVALDVAKDGRSAAKDPEGAVSQRSDAVLMETADVAILQIRRRYGGMQDILPLPNGSPTTPDNWSGLYVGRTHLVPIRNVPGLHVLNDRDFVIDGPGTRLLVEAVVRHAARLPRMDVPRLRPCDVVVRRSQYHQPLLCFPIRSGPAETCITEHQIEPPETLLDGDIEIVAERVAVHMLEAWRQRREIDAKGAEALEEIEDILAKARDDGLPLRHLGMHLGNPSIPGTKSMCTCAFEVIGNDLQPRTWLAHVWKKTLASVVSTQISTLRRRRKILEEARRTGAHGRIEIVTLAAIRMYSADPAETLRRIASEGRLHVPTGRRSAKERTLALTWRDGHVQSTFAFDGNVSWNQGRLVVKRKRFPEAVLQSIKGRSATAVLDHPLMNAGDIVTSTRVDGPAGKEWTTFNMRTEWTTFDRDTGEVDVMPLAA